MHMSTVQKNEIFFFCRQERSYVVPGVVSCKYRTVDTCMFVKCFVTCTLTSVAQVFHFVAFSHRNAVLVVEEDVSNKLSICVLVSH